MYTEISFPSFGITMDPPQTISIGSFSIHLYGLLIALGLALAVVYALRRRKQFGLTEDDLLDGVLWVTPFAILCARAYYCIFQWEHYRDNPISVLYIWEGGIAIYGSVIGAAIGIIVYCRLKKLRIATIMDIVSLGFLIGQIIGRFGNFFNREAFGAETESFFRMGLMNAFTGEVTYHHPTFLYEASWNLVGFVALHFLSKKRQYDGQVALGYALWYGLGRAWVEGLRTDSLYWGSFRVSQVLAAVTCVAAAIALAVLNLRQHDKENLFVNQRVLPVEKKTEEATEE